MTVEHEPPSTGPLWASSDGVGTWVEAKHLGLRSRKAGSCFAPDTNYQYDFGVVSLIAFLLTNKAFWTRPIFPIIQQETSLEII